MMHCRQCWERVGGDWVEWRQRHAVRLGDQGEEIVVVDSVILCAPPRVCVTEYASAAIDKTAAALCREAESEPF